MVLPDNHVGTYRKLVASDYLDMLLRVVALCFAVVFLLRALWTARDGTYPNVTGLSQAALMFLCVVSPLRPSKLMLAALLVAAAFAGFDFVVRALPNLRHENYPLDIVMGYLAELIIATWFMRKHS